MSDVLRAHGHSLPAIISEAGIPATTHRRISESFYFKLHEQGVGARDMRVGARVLISLESAERWRRERESTSDT